MGLHQGSSRASGEDPSDLVDSLYAQGIAHFNECEFFEAHEVWEELWTEYRGDSRRFYQGLIQAAVALHHFGNGNLRGARKVYETSCRYLREYLPAHRGLDLERFLAQYERCFASVLAIQEFGPSAVSAVPAADSDEGAEEIVIDPEQIPEIHLDASMS
jgi:hypothetical protein